MPVPATGTPVGLELPVKDTERASAFYNAVFNWTFLTENNVGAPLEKLRVFKVPGETLSDGGIIKKVPDEELATTSATTKVYLYVDDIESAMEKIVQNGGKKIGEKQAEGANAFHFFQDSEGNTHAIYTYNK